MTELRTQLSQHSVNIDNDYNNFESIFIATLNKHASLKTKFLRANNKPHMTKSLRKAMLRSHLKNRANKTKNPEDLAKFKVQRNLVVKLNKKARKSYFETTDPKQNSKGFWNACKPYFSDKVSGVQGKIILVERNSIISDDRDVSSTFNTYFNNITSSLNVCRWNPNFQPLNVDPPHHGYHRKV